MTAIRPRAHLDSGEGATHHALLDREVCDRDNGSPLHRRGSTWVLMALTDQHFIEFARRIKAQCERFDVFNGIDLQADPEQLRVQVCHARPNSAWLQESRRHPPTSSVRSSSMPAADSDTFDDFVGTYGSRNRSGFPEHFPD